MTTIKPRLGGINLNVKHIDSEGYALIQIGDLPKQVPGMRTVSVAARYPVADILAALDAVPRAEVVSELREARAERDEATAERIEVDAENSTLRATVKHLAAVTAERDALAETVERVKALASEWLLMGRITREKGSQLSAALTPPKPAFELPTEPGVRFKATDNCSKPCVFLSVWNGPDIAFVNERTSVIWDGENVLKYCTDHRLLDGAE